MQTYLYHREVYMPAGVKNAKGAKLQLKPTGHALRAASEDRYGRIDIPREISFNGSDIVEAEFTNGKLSKLVVRLPYDATRDAIYVCLPCGTLKTVWFNLRSDKHKTLKRHLYATA